MIPLIARVKLRFDQHRPSAWGFTIWLPLFLIWILLLPFVIVVLPFFIIGCLVGKLNPFTALAIFWEILTALRGTHVEVKDRSFHVVVSM